MHWPTEVRQWQRAVMAFRVHGMVFWGGGRKGLHNIACQRAVFDTGAFEVAICRKLIVNRVEGSS